MCTGWKRPSDSARWCPRGVPIAGSPHELPDSEALAPGTRETQENAAGGRRMRDSRAASVSPSGSMFLPGELQVDTRVVSPEPDGEQQQQQMNETVVCEPEAGFGEELAEETAATAADRRAPPTLVQPRRQGPGIPNAQELSASARARPHSALEPGRARAVESAVRTQQQMQLARPASASVVHCGRCGRPPVRTFSQTVRLHRRGAGLLRRARRPAPSHFPGPEQSPGPCRKRSDTAG